MTRPCRREPVAGHVQPDDFRHRASCRSVDPEIFFVTAVAGQEYERQVGIAKAVCGGCPVRAECLTWALSLPDGIAGGMTEQERRVEAGRRRGARRRHRPRPPRPAGATRAEIASAGRAAIASGMSAREAAAEFLVSPRTAERWARSAGEGSAGCHRAPLQTSHTPTQAGTRAEGTRS